MPCNICNCMHGCWHVMPSGPCPSLSTYFYVAVHYCRSSERRMPRRQPLRTPDSAGGQLRTRLLLCYMSMPMHAAYLLLTCMIWGQTTCEQGRRAVSETHLNLPIQCCCCLCLTLREGTLVNSGGLHVAYLAVSNSVVAFFMPRMQWARCYDANAASAGAPTTLGQKGLLVV